MKTKPTAQSAFFSLRVLVAVLLFAAAACLIASGALFAFVHSEMPAEGSQRTLSFAERVSYQRAIEEVYWRHRIWPKERSDLKPSLNAVMSQAQLEKKVADYLRKSQALEDYWQQSITAEQLQADMDRMARHTKQPEVLRELFDALGNDPFVIAECLARAVLADQTLPTVASVKESWLAKPETQLPITMASARASYTLPMIARPSDGCTDDTWTPTSLTNAPDVRWYHTAVWTGSEMIVWGGNNNRGHLNTGGRYNPSTDSWRPTSTTNAPSPREVHTAVWTGNEMIVWGGFTGSNYLNTGGRYNPASDTWAATSTANAPAARYFHTAAWTGSEMIVWGGTFHSGATQRFFNTGGKYNPGADSWTGTSTTDAPAARASHTAVWTGSEMIVWGGDTDSDPVNSGGRYNPNTNSWTAMSTANAPDERHNHSAVWSGNEMIVWGGDDEHKILNTGGRYNPITDTWRPTSMTNVPHKRAYHSAVWAGSEMVLWGGYDGVSFFDTGVKYNPLIDKWTAISTTHVPGARYHHTALWTGSEMIVWGGYTRSSNSNFMNTGGRYCAQSGKGGFFYLWVLLGVIVLSVGVLVAVFALARPQTSNDANARE